MVPWFSLFLPAYILTIDIIYLIFILIANIIYVPNRLSTIGYISEISDRKIITARDFYIMGALTLIFFTFYPIIVLYIGFNDLSLGLTDFDYWGLLILFFLWGTSSILAIIAAIKYGSHQ